LFVKTILIGVIMPKFFQWIEAQGGNAAIAQRFRISRARVSAWRCRKASPNARLMQRLVKASRGKIDFNDIIDATQPPTKRK
jgi:hypothetical protein